MEGKKRRLLNEVQLLITLISMIIILSLVAVSLFLVSRSMLADLQVRAIVTADEMAALLEYPLYTVDDESAVHIAKTFLSSGKISGVRIESASGGVLFTEVTIQNSPRIPDISRVISRGDLELGAFTLTFSDKEITRTQSGLFSIALLIIVAVLLANTAANRYVIAPRVERPFATILRGIRDLTEGNYQTQIELTRYADVNLLVAYFNEMAAKINEKNREQKKVEEALLAERQYLSDIIDFLPDATFIVDVEKKIVAWNRAIEEMTGVQREEMLGRGEYAYAEPFLGECRPILIDLLDMADDEKGDFYKYTKRTKTAIYGESYLARLNGGLGAHLWGVAAPLYDRYGRRTGAIEMIRDVTDLKIAEHEKTHLQDQLLQAQKMESVGRLAGGVAHDFNNMLTIILGHAQLAMAEKQTAESSVHHLQIIEETANRSADLVRQLLAFARKQTVDPSVVDINGSVNSLSKMLPRLIGEDIEVVSKPGMELWPVWIDSGQIDQILVNLCVNARDAIGGVGKMTIETGNVVFDERYCMLYPECLPGEYVMLAVSDNGCGMEKDVVDHIFEPFFTTKGIGKGTGMGLATVYGIARQNNGFVNVYSEPGKGTTFKVYLPRCQGDGQFPSPVRGEEIPLGSRETILLVEDDALILDMGRLMLEQLGYRVIMASSPLQALERMEQHGEEVQLLLTDVVMPEMNGRDLEGAMRQIKPGLKCLFTSGYTANVIAHHGVLDEGVCFLQKPFSLAELARKVRETLQRE